MTVVNWSRQNPRLALTIGFILWKTLILGIAATSPGIGYDTSTNHLVTPRPASQSFNDVPTVLNDKIFNLVRWDAIYYTQMAQRGLVLEQEWAFGIGLSSAISYLKQLLTGTSSGTELKDYIWVAVVLSHVSHWAVSMLVWSIARLTVLPGAKTDSISFVAAALHIISPGGIFLSAPYAESLFACLHMLGLFLFFKATTSISTSIYSNWLLRVLAGVLIGLATAIRSNGILTGTIFLVDAISLVKRLRGYRGYSFIKPYLFMALQFTIIGGICNGIGMLVPQYLAYQEYCSGKSEPRPWCNYTFPSIYTWVQSYYWNVGFLRYWTFGNMPLFLLAAPMLYIMIRSGAEGCQLFWSNCNHLPVRPSIAAQAALPQLLLAVLALFSYHVQIISRLSSGYPFWYIWLSITLHKKSSRVFVQFAVVYALIQAGLYASFLPPA